MRGHQAIADIGIITAESFNVKWHKDYFEHYYPAGKITSYLTSQKIELKVNFK